MSEAETRNKALVRRIYEDVWNRGDLSAASEIFAHPEGVQRFVGEFKQAFPDIQHVVEDLIAEDDRVVARFSAKGTHTGPWKGYAPVGNPVTYTGVTVARIAGGKIIEHRTWWDTLELIDQIRAAR